MRKFDYIIIGTGASGLQLAWRMSKDAFFKDKKVLMIDKELDKGNDRTWCFWEKGKGEWEDILYKSWDSIYFGSQWFEKTIKVAPYQYKMIRSASYYQKLWEDIQNCSNFEFLKAEFLNLKDSGESVQVLTSQETFEAKKVFSSIFTKPLNKENNYPFLKQHFVGWFVKTQKPFFAPTVATFMDFRIPQNGNTRFMYVLPKNEHEALVEYTLFSEQLLEKSAYEKGIEDYLNAKGIEDYEIIEKEAGVIPMTSYKFHKKNTKNVLYIGTAGGWTKASTGYTFKNIEKKTLQLINYLKKKDDFSKFQKINKFWYKDLLMLKVLKDDNSYGEKLFSDLFRKNSIQQLFKFLDEESSNVEITKLMRSVDTKRFVKAILSMLFK